MRRAALALLLVASAACGLLPSRAAEEADATDAVEGGLTVVPDDRPFDPSLVVDESDEGPTGNEHVASEARAEERERRDERAVQRIDGGAGDDEQGKLDVARNPPARDPGVGDAWPRALLDVVMELLLVLALSLLVSLPVWGALRGSRRAMVRTRRIAEGR